MFYISAPSCISSDVCRFVDGVKIDVRDRWWDSPPVRTADCVTHDVGRQCVTNVLRIKSILDADSFVLLMLTPEVDYTDCLVELGVALGRDMPCFVYNPGGAVFSSVYFNHPFIRVFDSREELLCCIGC